MLAGNTAVISKTLEETFTLEIVTETGAFTDAIAVCAAPWTAALSWRVSKATVNFKEAC